MWSRGSSPRERGTQVPDLAFRPGQRFIPARAGNATSRRAPSCNTTVHPRASGERPENATAASKLDGSSPRERGTLGFSEALGSGGRFIPARAGNAQRSSFSHDDGAVHPRASGERGVPSSSIHLADGSSPRERGTPSVRYADDASGRFIPARAGNALSRHASHSSVPVHPRASGERMGNWSSGASYFGSSPRERGTLGAAQASTTGSRFIPARAGNAYDYPRLGLVSAVHPRASGERLSDRPLV